MPFTDLEQVIVLDAVEDGLGFLHHTSLFLFPMDPVTRDGHWVIPTPSSELTEAARDEDDLAPEMLEHLDAGRYGFMIASTTVLCGMNGVDEWALFEAAGVRHIERFLEQFGQRRRTEARSPVPDRRCAVCGASLDEMRPTARYCSSECRQRDYRRRRRDRAEVDVTDSAGAAANAA
jgi:predicted nucleic acid-binding Zn ribbon protein